MNSAQLPDIWKFGPRPRRACFAARRPRRRVGSHGARILPRDSPAADEFKFTKITRARLPVFCELVDVLEQSDAHIAACIVDRSKGTDPFATSDPQWVAHARITAKLLVGIINKRELAAKARLQPGWRQRTECRICLTRARTESTRPRSVLS